jgi:hypothetical protein
MNEDGITHLVVDIFHILSLILLIIHLSDKPLPPQGPLDVSDITPETCSLSWKPPLDDGGSPVTNYIVEKLDPFSGVSLLLFSLKNYYKITIVHSLCNHVLQLIL